MVLGDWQRGTGGACESQGPPKLEGRRSSEGGLARSSSPEASPDITRTPHPSVPRQCQTQRGRRLCTGTAPAGSDGNNLRRTHSVLTELTIRPCQLSRELRFRRAASFTFPMPVLSLAFAVWGL